MVNGRREGEGCLKRPLTEPGSHRFFTAQDFLKGDCSFRSVPVMYKEPANTYACKIIFDIDLFLY
jgi:hypothetical protein